MKITKIQPNIISRNNYNNHTKPEQIQQEPQYEGKLPSTQQYLAFTGGYSLDLSQTVKQLDKLAEKNSDIYPPHIREWISMALVEGSKKTLIGVHKDYFSSLKDCFSLDKIKKSFSEFEDVIPATDVQAREGSFIDKFQKGELEFFDSDEDLSTQLIKLYWGEGFSLNDLKRYAGGIDLYYVMNKLHIPTASRDYGHYLKFSDPQYNERLTAEMTAKRLDALDRRTQMREGEPVYIPSKKRGPLSEEHKKHISEGQIRYWQEHPERIYEFSERQKDFYRENPERKEDFSRVLKRAWSIFGADHIKKAMSKFFKSKNVEMFDLENPLEMTGHQSKTLKEFWEQNEWAKKSFSKNMKHAWKKIKEENEMVFYVKTSPTQLVDFVEKKAGMNKGSIDVMSRYNPYLRTSSIDEKSNEIFKKYTDINGIADVMADTYQLSLFRMAEYFNELPKRKLTRGEQDFEMLLESIMCINKGDNGYKVQTTTEAQKDYIMLAQCAAESKSERLIGIVNKSLDEAFDFACQFHNFILK